MYDNLTRTELEFSHREAEKRIAELEMENTDLEKSCDETQELLDKQIEATYKLDKENTELKEELKKWKDEWHYVKDGDLPPKTTLVLIKACGCIILGWLDDNDVWHNDSDNGARIPKDNIYAWKEIVLPELKESE